MRRLARASVTDILVKLRTFFNWAQIHDLVPENPLAHETIKRPTGTFTVINERGEMIEISGSIGGTAMTLSNASAVTWFRLTLILKRDWFCI